MLAHLEVRNFVLIDRLAIDFGPGFNVVTGETGVGKSMLLSALTFLLGAKASASLVRTGERETTVSGLFHVEEAAVRAEIHALLPESGEDGDFLFSRTYTAEGANRCSINGQVVTVAMLRRAGESLMDIHGQHEHQSLLRSAVQLDILDEFGRLTDRRAAYQEAYRGLLDARRELEALRSSDRRDAERLEAAQAALEEIGRIDPQPGELEGLERERKRLAHAEKLAERAGSAWRDLYDGDGAVMDRLAGALTQLRKAAEVDDTLAPAVAALESASEGIGEAARTLGGYVESLAFDPARAREVEERHFAIQRLLARFGPTEAQLAQRRQEFEREMRASSGEAERRRAGEERVAALLAEALKHGRELSKARARGAERLRKAVEEELKALAMPHARFTLEFLPVAGEGTTAPVGEEASATPVGLSPAGLERVEFLFTPNPGEPPLPLRKVASGGELARFMLGVKKVLAESDRVPIQVFDEIDANVGGRLGGVLGEKLLTIAARRQVLCVTHMAQIAAYGDRHFRVEKRVQKGSTSTEFTHLDGQERLEEVAEMIKGRPPTATTLRQAQEMMADAAKLRRKLERRK